MTSIKKTSVNYENKLQLGSECAQVYAALMLGGQWTLAICCHLAGGKLRFGELRKKIPAITERMLTLQLRKMETNKLIVRKVYAEVPPRVEYELSESGQKLIPILIQLDNWGRQHQEYLQQHA
ncbi:transcriptional regulator, HxlR family [Chitinophaga jiangningensis]|uniref:Transcriptional regulator, HxlR family n=1 Tax=Chitinophaga jiangningensis TaxID=1419482 RepID=A0A1M7N4L1_9BACT|nr:helix-turn-helix domain-containing protein [Chitinophaga jiangningensis]SHM98405.1 transcriptional regulator, HxlR family [Chitinophaga jiangningensis]